MAFDAGSVVGHFRLDDAEWKAGAGRVQGSTKGLTGSVFKATLAYDLFKKGLAAAVNVLKTSIAEYNQHERAVAQTTAVLKSTAGVAGMTRDAVVGLSDQMMALTGIEHDNVLQAENLLLTFTKIGSDIFPQATETVLDMSVALGQDAKAGAIQLGKALQDPILGVTALRRVGVNFNTAQIEVIKNLVRTGRSAEAQAMILKELQTEFGGSARAARDTFGGALMNLTNQTNEVKEAIGRYIATAGRPFVENAAEAAKGIADWMNSAQGISTITSILAPLAGTFSVIVDIGKQLWDMFANVASVVGNELKTGFIDLFGTGNDASIIFQVLGTVVKTVGIGFTILGKIIAMNIRYVFNLVKIARDSIEVLVALADALAHPFQKAKWDTVGKAAEKTWEQIKKTGVDAFTDVKDIVNTTINEFKNLIAGGKVTGQALEASFEEASERMRVAMSKFTTTTTGGFQGVPPAAEDAASEIKETWLETFRRLRDSMKDVTGRFGVMSSAGRAAIDELAKHIIGLSDSILSTISDATNGIMGVVQQRYTNEQTEEDNDYERKKAYIEANVADEDERNKQLEALEKDHAKKSAEIKKKQFQAQKTADIISAVISTAQAVMSTFAKFGFPWGLIPAAIMAAIGAAQVATIASQPTPEFAAEGGSFAAGTDVVVGERGPELLRLGTSAQVIPNDELTGGRRATRDEEFTLHATFVLDGRTFADFTTRAIRNGQIVVEAKDIR